ncbi:DUF6328 family protein [Streptomyces sp. bgisy031]|uniref:DUF6328 family protein n=1 Tax=Streptomyces sp. bgisy031 TaxID=3413772 RepID=UPI003D746113
MQTGAQILFAFLLSLAFSGRFTSLDDFGLGTYTATLVLTVITTTLIATPIAVRAPCAARRPLMDHRPAVSGRPPVLMAT